MASSSLISCDAMSLISSFSILKTEGQSLQRNKEKGGQKHSSSPRAYERYETEEDTCSRIMCSGTLATQSRGSDQRSQPSPGEVGKEVSAWRRLTHGAESIVYMLLLNRFNWNVG